MSSNELLYTIRFSTEGKPEIVEATDDLEKQNQVVREHHEALGKTTIQQGNVNEQTAKARIAFQETQSAISKTTSEVDRISVAERNLDSIMAEANERLTENTYQLENARLEYETGAVTQEQYTARLRELQAEIQSIDAPSGQLIRRQREINRELTRMNPAVEQTTRGFSTANSAMFTSASALARINPALGSTTIGALSAARSIGQLTSSTGGLDAAMKSMVTFAMSPAGIVSVLAVTAAGVAFLIDKFNLLEKQTIDLEAVSKSYVDTLDDLIKKNLEYRDSEAGIFDSSQLEERLEYQREQQRRQEEHLEQLREERSMLTELGATGRITLEQVERRNDVVREIEFREKNIERSKEIQLELEADIYEISQRVNDENFRRQEGIRLQNDLQEVKNEKLREEIELLDELFKAQEIQDPEFDFGDDIDLSDDQEWVARQMRFFEHEEEIRKMRVQSEMIMADELEKNDIQLREATRKIRQNDLIELSQQHEMIEELELQHQERKRAIEEQNERERLALIEESEYQIRDIRRETNDMSIANAQLAANAISAINTAFLDDNKGLAVAMFATQKALDVAQVVMQTIRRSTEASMQAAVLASNPVTAAYAPIARANAMRIRRQGFTAAGIMAAMSIAEGVTSFGSGGGTPNVTASWRSPAEMVSGGMNIDGSRDDRDVSFQFGEGVDAIYLKGKEISERRGTADMGALA